MTFDPMFGFVAQQGLKGQSFIMQNGEATG